MQWTVVKTNTVTGGHPYHINIAASQMYYLQQPRFQLPVKHNVKAQDLEAYAVTVWGLSRPTHLIRVVYMR